MPAEPAPDDRVPVGRIAGAYGVRGWVRITPYSSARDSVLTAIRQGWLAHTGLRPIEIVACRPQGSSIVAQLQGVDDRNAAEALKGAEVLVSRSAFPPSGDDEYYWVDLVGCRVVSESQVELGRVEELQEYGAHPLLAVRGTDRKLTLIPFVARHIRTVDLACRQIVVDWDPDF